MAFATKLEKQDLERLVRPKLKLFLSVDVVGSTAFKQAQPHFSRQRLSSSGGPSNWLMFLSSFYKEFGNRLRLQLGQRLEVAGISEPAQVDAKVGTPHLWKALGDELVFVLELKLESHLPIILDAFRHAINEEIDNVKAGEHPLPISLKGSAWVAGFPVCNAEIPMIADPQDGDKNGRVVDYDYAGPSMDIGFRISKFASPHRLVVSAEVAYLLTKPNSGGEIIHHLHLEDPVELKGVLGGDEYPLFWIDCFKDIDRTNWLKHVDHCSHTAEQERYYSKMEEVRPSTQQRDKIREFLDSWFDRHRQVLVKPFIPKNEDATGLPTEYRGVLELVEAELRELYRSDEDRDDGSTAGDQLVETGLGKVSS